ncbi:cytochrome P450 [Aspergillus homomorphus CBS 101889]|uniref:Cytochrome P450 n=1 Tax=Aspergillus homomorphus (strain CBS 101889) TaxID=1450537 RepID=A0A395I511_ASPHC|nr:cytochrome P450 [Aspergillus homomorphus CBS 101889]RAL15302.1 cytochrome P450 [Aspergillus homomorphus CBS 101889]
MSAVKHMVAHERDLVDKEGRKPDYFSRVIIDEVAGFTIAAYETTRTTLCWGFKYLTDFPEIQSNLRRALEKGYMPATRTGRSRTIQEILNTDVPYLKAAVQEILRFTNLATAFDRQALTDTQILGHAVPKGTIVTCVLLQPALVSPGDVSKLSTGL